MSNTFNSFKNWEITFPKSLIFYEIQDLQNSKEVESSKSSQSFKECPEFHEFQIFKVSIISKVRNGQNLKIAPTSSEPGLNLAGIGPASVQGWPNWVRFGLDSTEIANMLTSPGRVWRKRPNSPETWPELIQV